MEHRDAQVQQAITRLADALCMWERGTGRQSVLILREQDGFEFRAVNGKPGVPEDVSDQQLFDVIGE